MRTNKLKIKEIRKETVDAVSVLFDVPLELKDSYQFKPGQYVTLIMMLDGEEVRRNYSMSASPLDNELRITVKKVEGGLVSNYLNDTAKVGDEIAVMKPGGRFVPKIDRNNKVSYFLFGGGSGITPLMSIASTVLREEPKSYVNLFYGNKDEDSIIFKRAFDELAKAFPQRFNIEHILAEPVKREAKLFGVIPRKRATWKGMVGLADANNTLMFLNKYRPQTRDRKYFICGPGPMMDGIEKLLLNQWEVNPKDLFLESFGGDKEKKEINLDNVVKTGFMEVTINGQKIETEINQDKTVLDCLLDMEVDAPYSCREGRCATCLAKITEGEVKMDECLTLEQDEIDSGLILTCQSRLISPKVKITYDNVE